MGWKERLDIVPSITTGDGKKYDILMQTSTYEMRFEFQISEFEFPETVGTNVDRRLRKGYRYPLEFYFQGDDVIEQQNAFLISAEVKKPWVLQHPFYGRVTGQPLGIAIKNDGINTAQFNIEFVETIVNAGPETVLDPKENVFAISEKAKETSATVFANTVEPTVSDVQMMKKNADDLYKEGSKGLSGDAQFNNYTNLYNTALTKINVAFNDASTAVSAVQAFIEAPYLFEQSVKARLQTFLTQANKLSLSLENVFTSNEKKIFENQKGTLILSAINAVNSPLPGDYTNAPDVISTLEFMLGMYNTFIDELQTLQSPSGISSDPYAPNADFMSDLMFTMDYTASNLLEIALNAQQERSLFLEYDSNIIVQTHRFYGLLPDDSTIQQFIATNQIKLNEYWQLKKGRKLIYYV